MSNVKQHFIRNAVPLIINILLWHIVKPIIKLIRVWQLLVKFYIHLIAIDFVVPCSTVIHQISLKDVLHGMICFQPDRGAEHEKLGKSRMVGPCNMGTGRSRSRVRPRQYAADWQRLRPGFHRIWPWFARDRGYSEAVSYTHLTLPTIYSV